jgi:hypothetical protein
MSAASFLCFLPAVVFDVSQLLWPPRLMPCVVEFARLCSHPLRVGQHTDAYCGPAVQLVEFVATYITLPQPRTHIQSRVTCQRLDVQYLAVEVPPEFVCRMWDTDCIGGWMCTALAASMECYISDMHYLWLSENTR